MSGAPDVLQIKEDILKFLAIGTHLCGTNLDFQMEQVHLQEEKFWHLIIKEENLREASAGAHAIIIIRTQLMSVSGPPGTLGSKSAAAIGPRLLQAISLLDLH